MKRIIAPPFLVPGDRIALLSPSYHVPAAAVEGAADVLRAWGFEPVVGANVGKRWRGSYAGSPEERLADLRAALEDPSIKAILCNRGGYGTIRFAEMLPLEELAAHPKWLVGFSDITTLCGMEARAGVMSIHGPMGKFLAKTAGAGKSAELLRGLLTGTVPEYALPAHPLSRPGTATAPLVGGNLSTFVPLLGTRADATAGREILLFIEEIEEDYRHIDRLINTLRLHGVFDRCRGVILGQFTGCEANPAAHRRAQHAGGHRRRRHAHFPRPGSPDAGLRLAATTAAVDQAACRLKPPVTASTSSASPAK